MPRIQVIYHSLSEYSFEELTIMVNDKLKRAYKENSKIEVEEVEEIVSELKNRWYMKHYINL